ncbi:MAG TPA: hypothetical protein VH351_11590 [Bryobacteraceae bacterium]|jgi:hypothetical protein|nr:hypothetical protein [Bryobacteraceae bacterium]
MSAAPQTKIFGITLGVDPKFVVGGLLAIALLVLYFNSRSSGGSSENSSTNTADTRSAAPAIAYPGTSAAKGARRRNRNAAALDRGTLRIRPVDASRGDIDPTLRLDMLARLQTISADTPGRSLFEAGSAAAVPSAEAVAKLNTNIEPAPLPATPPPSPTGPVTPQVNIPLRFYGFVRPAAANQRNRGLFMSGDNVIVASEGETIEGRYLVVELTANAARMEDTQIKQGQTLPVVPEANQQ